MTLTIGNWVWIGICLLVFVSTLIWWIVDRCGDEMHPVLPIVTSIISLVIGIVSMFILSWYNTSTASGIRHYKDYTSEMENGIEREVTITAEDGRVIFHYEGKIDIGSANVKDANYICFETQDGKRYLIYYGVQDTLLIIEK